MGGEREPETPYVKKDEPNNPVGFTVAGLALGRLGALTIDKGLD